jgi:hypothetical protein
MKTQTNKVTNLVVGAVFALGLSLSPALANSSDDATQASYGPQATIYSNPGGRIIDFALQSAKYRESGKLVKFAGQCDSACTLFLGLPRNQMCVAPGASFRFHAPVSANARAALKAKQYLLRKYPGWVRSYIAQRGGLTRNLITMDYAVASRYLPSCGRTVASR